MRANVALIRLVCSASVLASFAIGGVSRADDLRGPSKDIKQIEAQLDTISQGYRMGDAKMAMDPYVRSESEMFVFDLVKPVVDRGYTDNLKKTANFIALADGPTLVEYTDRQIVVDHDMAYGAYLLHFAGKLKSGQTVDMHGRTTQVFQRIGGKWLIVHEHDSTPVDAVADWSVKK